MASGKVEQRWTLRRIDHIREHILNVKKSSFNGELDLAINILNEWEKEERCRVRSNDMKLKKGDIVFIDNESWLSKIIQVVTSGSLTKKVPSHVGIVIAIRSDKVTLIEATLRGVILTDMALYYRKILCVKRMRGARDMDRGLVWLASQVGIGYDYTQLFGMLARTFWRLFGKKVYERSRRVRNFLNSKQRMVCSELVEIFASITGKRLWKDQVGFVTPYDLSRSEELDEIDFDYFDA